MKLRVDRYPIDYCVSEMIENQKGSVKFSWDVMIVVLIFNTAKLAVMGYMIVRFGRENLLITAGDAISLFLIREDHITMNKCLRIASSAGWPWRQ